MIKLNELNFFQYKRVLASVDILQYFFIYLNQRGNTKDDLLYQIKLNIKELCQRLLFSKEQE